MAGHGAAREGVDGMERGGCVARAAAQSGPDRNALGQRQMHREALTRGLQHQGRRSHRQVLLRWPHVGTFHLDRDPPPIPLFRPERVRQAHEAKERLEAVIAVALAGQHAEEQVELGRCGDGDHGPAHGCWVVRRSLSATGVRASDQAPSRMMGTKVAAW